jgi:activator of 2-hydroxyglutaryl-CoA dehydratase
MKYAGIDIGSRTMELVVVEDGQICLSKEADTGFDPVAGARQILEGVEYDQIMATGYGRHLFEMSFDHASTVTEIKAHAQGAYALFQNKGMIIDNACILDIGGQDSKAIALYKNGRVRKFEMNVYRLPLRPICSAAGFMPAITSEISSKSSISRNCAP